MPGVLSGTDPMFAGAKRRETACPIKSRSMRTFRVARSRAFPIALPSATRSNRAREVQFGIAVNYDQSRIQHTVSASIRSSQGVGPEIGPPGRPA